MEWVSVKDEKFPSEDDYITGYCLPVISRLYGYGVLVKSYGWSFTTDHKLFRDTSTVTHWMRLPK